MNNEELYIDNERVDTDGKTKVTLDIKSNLLQDISKIVSNHTYTIKLPKTARNQRIVQHSDLVQGRNDYPYRVHNARFFRNGVEVIKNGRAVIMQAGDDIEVSIVWGLFPAFSDMVSKGTTLNQLESTARILYNNPNTLETYANAKVGDYFYAKFEPFVAVATVNYEWRYGSGMTYPLSEGRATGTHTFGGSRSNASSEGVAYLHPSVRVPWILNLIKESLGVEFRWENEAKEYIEQLIIPLIAHKSNELTFDGQFQAELQPRSTLGMLDVKVTEATNLFSDTAGSTVQQLSVTANADIVFDVSADWGCDMTNMTPNGYSGHTDADGNWVYYDHYLFPLNYIKMTVGKETYTIGYSRSITRVPRGYKGIVKFNMTGYGKVEVKAGQKVTFEFCHDKGALNGLQFYGGTIKANVMSDDEVPSGAYFPIASNLPNIKIIDFVKFLACITGTFPLQIANDSQVRFVPISTVWNNAANAIDWTAKVVAPHADNKPKQMEYKLSDWKQHNRYKWKEDDTVVGNYDGDLLIENETLELERDVFTFPFAASDGSRVPMYENKSTSSGGGSIGGNSDTSSSDDDDEEDTGPSYKACKDRILRLYEMENGKAGGFFDISMQSILDEKYSDLIRTLQDVKVLKEKIILSDAEIQQFDETKPVYLAQYGRYFAVLEIKSEGNGVSEVTLLQLHLEDE